MGGVLTDWQKAVNTIAHALNKAGYDGDSPESKALELLAGRCEGTADAKEIAKAAIDANTMYQREYLPSHYAQYGEFGDSDHLVLRVDYIAEAIAPLLKPSVDIGKLAVQLARVNINCQESLPETISDGDVIFCRPSRVDAFEKILTASLTDSAGEIERLKEERLAFATESEERKQEIERLRAKIDRFKEILQRADSFCSLVYHRYSRSAIPEDVREDLAKISKDSRAALSGGAEKEGEDHGNS